MNNEIERSLIAIFLNHPKDTQQVDINPEWFADKNMRELYISAAAHADTDPSAIEIYGMASKNLVGVEFSNVSALKNEYITDSSLQSLATQLHHEALNRELEERIGDWRKAPYADSEEAMAETLTKIRNLGSQADDGSVTREFSELADRLTHARPVGIKSYGRLDDLLGGGMYGGMLFTIGARPAVGKTSFAVNMAYEITKADPEVHVDYFTLEMNKQEMVNRLISRESGISSAVLRDPYNKLKPELHGLVTHAINYYTKLKIRVFDKTPMLSDIITTIRRNAAKAKPNKYVAIVDYIGLVEVSGSADRYLQIGQITRDLKMTANDFSIPIIALTQLNRGIEARMDKTPMLSDIRESGSVEQDSNVVAFLSKPFSDEPDIVRLSIAKNREGTLGQIHFAFIGREMLFKEVPDR
ncbi:DnaB helicase C-terminal domain-containing protein [Pediococcus inopinatus]|uniref:DnaB-like helicase C-terminal domain-containing protein n=1 Tax=Pediococcus inopinatus TaxID=114090 RepID=UPI002B263325|nr:DnaB-like helicase C-terminal domain-containing protein [Pediococcus inopinatus]WPC19471.1 DnaB helicase C-terminal domain-containing protein [Pediococcus inopinatus]